MDSFMVKTVQAGQIFTPGSPVNTQDLFAGRIDQLNRIVGAVSQRGYHAVLFGERGVGKTSLANVLVTYLQQQGYLIAKVNCDAGDNFSTIWRKALKDITVTEPQMGIGFTPQTTKQTRSVADSLPLNLQPDDVRRVLTDLSSQRPTLIILDEFDRIEDKSTSTMVADTIKALSDFGAGASILLIGVAESISELVSGHLSIERALVQIPMPRMTDEEIEQIFDKGMQRLGMQMEGSAISHLRQLSQGLPYIAHLLALHSTRATLGQRALTVLREHVDTGILSSLEQWQESIKVAYYQAVKSHQPGNIYKQVLLACAMAQVDELGFFTAAAVRAPLSKIANRTLDIPNFARHLKEFSEEVRGKIITRVGAARRLRYRFVNPLMRPYVIMRGYADQLIS